MYIIIQIRRPIYLLEELMTMYLLVETLDIQAAHNL